MADQTAVNGLEPRTYGPERRAFYDLRRQMSALAAEVAAGGGGGGAEDDEVWIGDDPPVPATTELWVDTNEVAPVQRTRWGILDNGIVRASGQLILSATRTQVPGMLVTLNVQPGDRFHIWAAVRMATINITDNDQGCGRLYVNGVAQVGIAGYTSSAYTAYQMATVAQQWVHTVPAGVTTTSLQLFGDRLGSLAGTFAIDVSNTVLTYQQMGPVP